MTTATTPAALTQASMAAGLVVTGAAPLRAHATDVWLLPAARAVARIGRKETLARASDALSVVNWLVAEGFPAPEPLVCEPVAVDDVIVTFWQHYPQPEASGKPPVGALGAILRDLHALGRPPVDLAAYKPLSELGGLLLGEEARGALDIADRSWLTERADQLAARYVASESVLGVGLVHGDAYPGNLMWGERGAVLLGDWDEVAVAPRELDLANTYQGIRFGRSSEELADFTEAYGFDVRRSPLFPVLREMRDLHTLASFVRRAARGDDAARLELRRRVASLRDGDEGARWRAA